MVFSKTVRLLLVGTLPLVALLVYIEGQEYDSALIRFQSSPSGSSAPAAFFPREVAGLSRRGQLRSYTRENLYEYVNGHAEYFISSGFINLAVGEYAVPGSGEDEPDVVVDIYDMGRSIQAFGVLSDEAGGRLSEIHPGVTGFKTPLGISFVKGQFYIKISAYRESAPLASVAEGLALAVGADSDPFPEFSRLPDIGEVVTTRFIKEAYRGLDFVHDVIERQYRVKGETVEVFAATGERSDIRKTADSFLDYFRRSDIPYSLYEKEGKEVYRIRDPYEGDWVLISLPDALFGVFGSFDDSLIDTLLAEKGSPETGRIPPGKP